MTKELSTQNQPNRSTGRIGAVDAFKFGLSILVVIIHLKPFPGIDPLFRPILRLAVPLFFIISSFFFFKKQLRLGDLRDKISHLERFAFRNGALYLFWTVVLLVPTAKLWGWFDDGLLNGALTVLKNFLFSGTFRASWFLLATIIGMVIVVVASRYFSNRIMLLIACVIYTICCLMSNYADASLVSPHLGPLKSFFGVSYNRFWVAIFWIFVGKLLAEHASKLSLVSTSKLLSSLAVGFFALYLEYAFILSRSLGSIDDCYFMLPAVAVPLFVLVLRLNVELPSGVAEFFRVASTVTYCLHFTLKHMLQHLFELLAISMPPSSLFIIDLVVCWGVALVILTLRKRAGFHLLNYAC